MSQIELVDSNEFHKDRASEIKFQLTSYTKLIRKIVLSKWFIGTIIWMACFKYSSYYKLENLYFIITIFVLIFTNLGTREKGTLSAYSVFNEGCQQILGTMDTAQIDNQIRGGFAPNNAAPERRFQMNNQKELEERESYKDKFDKKNLSKKGNMECYCGSQRKYKKCCYWRELREEDNKEL